MKLQILNKETKMKKFKTLLSSLTSTLIISGLFLSVNACTNSPFQPANTEANVAEVSLAKKGKKDKGDENGNDEDQNQGGNGGPSSFDDLLEQNSRWRVASE